MLQLVAWASFVYWVVTAVCVLRTVRAVPRLGDAEARPSWPRVSLIVPGRDEAAHVEAALRSKLEDDYPNLEVVFVDDRSRDATGAIADRLAREEPRLRVVHVDVLPPGWLGKVHALQCGLERATGAWILFSDADVRLARGTLRRVVAMAERERADHLTLIPHMWGSGWLLGPTLAAFFRMIIVGGRLWSVPRPDSSAAMGIGAFNLVRRTALERSPGLSWLRLEVADDVALGVMLKRSGGRARVVHGCDWASLEFYGSFRGLLRGMEKNGATIRLPLLVAGQIVYVALELGFLAGSPSLLLATVVLAAATSMGLAHWLRVGLGAASFSPFGGILLAFAMLRSATLAWWRGGVRWRDTFYATPELRRGRRLGVSLRVREEEPHGAVAADER